MDRDYTIKYLAESLMASGTIGAKTTAGGIQTVKHWIRTGKLTLRSRPHSGWKVVTDNEVMAVIRAFSPGGPGVWHFYDEQK